MDAIFLDQAMDAIFLDDQAMDALFLDSQTIWTPYSWIGQSMAVLGFLLAGSRKKNYHMEMSLLFHGHFSVQHVGNYACHIWPIDPRIWHSDTA